MKKRKWKLKKGKEDMSLQITAMADVFTVILVFLIKSFSLDSGKITPHNNISLPAVGKAEPISESLKLEISEGAILLDEKPVTELSNFSLAQEDTEGDGTSRSLNIALTQNRKKNTLENQPKLLILADRTAPYSIVKKVLMSANTQGFEDFKLVVMEDQ